MWLGIEIRRLRTTSPTVRFAFVIGAYGWACTAFATGAVLGGLLGSGALQSGWYAAGRLAHVHVNLLGWGGLTLLASIVFLGPTIVRARMEPGADRVASAGLRVAASGLAVGPARCS